VDDVPVDADVPVDVGMVVGGFVVPSVGPAVPVSAGVLRPAPPPLITVEMPPLERTLTLVVTVVVDVEDPSGVIEGVVLALEPSGISGAVGRSRMVAGAVVAGTIASALELALVVGAGRGADGRAGTARALCTRTW
jgi:hypothetical protein